MKIIAIATVLCGALAAGSPAFAQMDLTGSWASRMHEDWIDRFPGPDVVDYLGLPLNDEGRAKALAYSSSQLSMPERQCLMYQPQYTVLGPQSLQIWPDADPVSGRLIALKISGAGDRSPRTIWMDGRAHPPKLAPHAFEGFSTGVWQGTMLIVSTTHMKAGYLRRNGVPGSDETTMTEFFVRHDQVLTITAVIDDPVYLSEPHVISRSWQLDPDLVQTLLYANPCTPSEEIERLGVSGTVPHYLPGRNPFVNEVGTLYHLPLEAVLGSARTLYPEYRKTLKPEYVAPSFCARYCCGWLSTLAPTVSGDASGLNCTPAVH